MPSSSRAIYVAENGKFKIIDVPPNPYTPTGNQSLVAVKYSAINPADRRHFYMGMNSYILGSEWVGPVVAVGPASPHKVGDVLFGLRAASHRRPAAFGSHQDYSLVELWMTYKVPDDMLDAKDWPQVASWCVGAQTAADALFNQLGFEFPPLPEVQGVDPRGRAILIWGGSSTVGLATIQLAKAAGFSPIFTTASPRNHATLLELGATACFDYRSPTVEQDVRAAAAASGKDLSVVFDAVTTGTGFAELPADSNVPLDFTKSSPATAKRCLTEGARDVRLCASLVVAFDEEWAFCLSFRDPVTEAGLHSRLDAVVEWLFVNHGSTGFRMPRVRVVKGAEEGVRMIQDVFDGRVSMEKVVIEHPM